MLGIIPNTSLAQTPVVTCLDDINDVFPGNKKAQEALDEACKQTKLHTVTGYNTAVQIPEGAETIDYITRLQIDYSQISLKSKIPDNELSYAKYLVNNKGKLELKKEYTTYSFADQYTHFKKQSALKK